MTKIITEYLHLIFLGIAQLGKVYKDDKNFNNKIYIIIFYYLLGN